MCFDEFLIFCIVVSSFSQFWEATEGKSSWLAPRKICIIMFCYFCYIQLFSLCFPRLNVFLLVFHNLVLYIYFYFQISCIIIIYYCLFCSASIMIPPD